MNAVEKRFTTVLSPKPGTCAECAIQHDPAQPHNQQSLYYQMSFYQANGRYPTWLDALAHCSPEVQEVWKAELRGFGVEI